MIRWTKIQCLLLHLEKFRSRGMHDIVRMPAATLARYQIYVIDPATGADVPEASSSHASTQVSVSQAEWDANGRATAILFLVCVPKRSNLS